MGALRSFKKERKDAAKIADTEDKKTNIQKASELLCWLTSLRSRTS